MTTVTWKTDEKISVEVRVGAPDGKVFARTGGGATSPTGNWVGDGDSFYLQDASGGDVQSAAMTIATVSVKHTKEGCPK